MVDTDKPVKPDHPILHAVKFLLAPRMAVWLWLSVVLLLGLWWFAAHMLKVVLFKVVLITVASFIGDKVARLAENSNPRPHELLAEANRLNALVVNVDAAHERARDFERRADAVYYRRAIIIGAAMIAASLGA